MVVWRINIAYRCGGEDFFSRILASQPRRSAATRHFLNRSILFHAEPGELPPSKQSDLAVHQKKNSNDTYLLALGLQGSEHTRCSTEEITDDGFPGTQGQGDCIGPF